MAKVSKWRILIRGALLFIAVLAIITVYALLGSVRQSPVDLCDTFDTRHGWTYEVVSDRKARPFEPVFQAESYGMEALGDDCRAVKISRVMTEEYESAKLTFYVSESGIEVALGEEILYSDFNTLSRGSNGYLTIDDGDFTAHMSEFRTITFPLPSAHEGKTLTVITYFPSAFSGERLPVYPVVETEWATDGVVVEAVKPVASMTLFALLAVLLLVMFLIDGGVGRRDWSFAFLAGYYLMLFLFRAYASLPGVYSRLSSYWIIGMTEHLYPTLIYMALASRLSGWRKWGLLSASIAQLAFCVCLMAKNYFTDGFIHSADDGKTAAALLVLTLVFVLIERAGKKDASRKHQYAKISVALFVAVVYIVHDARGHDFPLDLYFRNMFDSAWEFGNFLPFVTSISAITAYAASIMLIWFFIDRLFERQRAYMAITERNRLTLEHYQTLLDLTQREKNLRHEMKHHLNAISAFLNSGEYERAGEYVSNVSGQARDTLPVSLSRNLLVNAIVERYMQSARNVGIEVNAHVLIPAELNIEDEDLCVYLSNLLENALEACEKLDSAATKYIRFTMEKQGNFVYIGCRNSCANKAELNESGLPNTTKDKPDEHGYGMIAMRRVAEKYNSVLLIKQTPGEFSVMTNLLINNRQACSA